MSDIKDTVRAQFGRAAESYVTSVGHARGEDLAELVKWLAPEAHCVALDIATGGGHTAKALAPCVRMVVASDLTKEMLAAACRHLADSGVANAVFVLADAEALPFLDETFDIVTCRIAPHHFPHPAAFVSEVARVLKPGGQFLLIDNVSPENPAAAAFLNTLERMRDKSHVRCLTAAQWRSLCTANHLVIARESAWMKPVAVAPWLSRMVTDDALAAGVKAFAAGADDAARETFSIRMEPASGEVASFSIPEWMALAVKSGQPPVQTVTP